MDLDNFKNTWQQQNTNTDRAIKINQAMLTEMKVNKKTQELNNMKWARIVESAVFLCIIVLLWQYVANHFSVSAPTISAFILNIFAIVGFAGNVGQIVLISKVDYSKPISEVQKNIYWVCSQIGRAHV